MQDYVIVEIIPNNPNYLNGNIIQLQALKVKDKRIIERMDYRLSYDLIDNKDLIKIISYDQDMFTYTRDKDEIMNKFQHFAENFDLFIIDNFYTNGYLKDINNKKISVFNYLNIINDDDAFNNLIDKYQLESSNHLVDLLYEAITYHDA